MLRWRCRRSVFFITLRGREIALQGDAIASRLVDHIQGHSYDEWAEYVDKLRAENIGDTVIDMAADQTINGVQSGHVHSPAGTSSRRHGTGTSSEPGINPKAPPGST